MNPEKARELLEKYWECTLSVEEEQTLQTFFLGQKIPKDLLPYRALFSLTSQENTVKMENHVNAPTLQISWKNWFPRVAAILLVGLAMWISYSFLPTQLESNITSNYTEIEDPEVAYKKTKEALMMISRIMEKSQYEKSIERIAYLDKYIKPKKNIAL